MFGDLFSKAEEQQKAMREKLADIVIETEAGDGAIQVKANANKEILNIRFNKELLDWDDQDQVEDLLLVAINRAINLATEKEAEASQALIKDMLPPGMGNLFGM